ncbi:MAG: hypothetical protein ACRCUP_05735 [Mycoplasmatales bacterium]
MVSYGIMTLIVVAFFILYIKSLRFALIFSVISSLIFYATYLKIPTSVLGNSILDLPLLEIVAVIVAAIIILFLYLNILKHSFLDSDVNLIVRFIYNHDLSISLFLFALFVILPIQNIFLLLVFTCVFGIVLKLPRQLIYSLTIAVLILRVLYVDNVFDVYSIVEQGKTINVYSNFDYIYAFICFVLASGSIIIYKLYYSIKEMPLNKQIILNIAKLYGVYLFVFIIFFGSIGPSQLIRLLALMNLISLPLIFYSKSRRWKRKDKYPLVFSIAFTLLIFAVAVIPSIVLIALIYTVIILIILIYFKRFLHQSVVIRPKNRRLYITVAILVISNYYLSFLFTSGAINNFQLGQSMSDLYIQIFTGNPSLNFPFMASLFSTFNFITFPTSLELVQSSFSSNDIFYLVSRILPIFSIFNISIFYIIRMILNVATEKIIPVLTVNLVVVTFLIVSAGLISVF